MTKQLSERWFQMKRIYLGANDCASLLGHGYESPDTVIKNKIALLDPREKVHSTHLQNLLTRGSHYEPIVRKEFSLRNKVDVKEAYLKKHSRKLNWLTASPDGVCSYDGKKCLLELKVKSYISDKIPYGHWIQMQIQMAVHDYEYCLYCQNNVQEKDELDNYDKKLPHGEDAIDKKYWILQDYDEILVKRDRKFFQDSIPILKEYWKKIIEGRVRNKDCGKEEPSLKITPSMLHNFVREDPLLDWLNKYGPPEKKDSGTGSKFMNMIFRMEMEFASLVRNYVKRKYSHIEGFVKDIDPCSAENYEGSIEPTYNSISEKSLELTKLYMKEGVPIIINPCFRVRLSNDKEVTLEGSADMICMNHYIKSIFGDTVPCNEKSPSSYSIVNIKHSTINHTADSVHLLNNKKQKTMKSRLWILNRALAELQDFNRYAYVIGKRYTCSKGNKDNAFESIGVIDFEGRDEQYKELFWRGLSWIKLLQDPISETFDPFNNKGRAELMPNMKNDMDNPWRTYKTEIAEATDEVTLKYRSNVKHRNKEFSDLSEYAALFHDTVPEKSHAVEFYIDFESIGDIFTDFKHFPKFKSHAMIFLIGMVVVDHVKKTSKYYSFVADSLNKSSETQILNSFMVKVKQYCDLYDQETCPLIFWGNAEKYMLERSLADKEITKTHTLLLLDMCKYFRENNIVYPGQKSFKLKDVATCLHKLGIIDTIWPDSDIVSGLDAMVEGIQYLKHRKDTVLAQKFYKDVIEYNRIDCYVMYEIVADMRYIGKLRK